MKALAISGRGVAPAVLEVDDPTPGPGEVRIRVEAASVNGFDVVVADGRVWDQMAHAFPVVLGRDFAGTVESVGPDVDDSLIGSRVAGLVTGGGLGRGAIAELLVAAASSVTPVPDKVSSADAAALGLAGVTALDAVDALDVVEDDVVVVSGATGGVGTFAVQLAATKGATIIGTAMPGLASDLVQGLGADTVVDFRGDVPGALRTVAPDGVTALVHLAGDAAALAPVLVAGGRIVSTLGASLEQVGRDDVTVTAIVTAYTPTKLATLLAAVADGELTVAIGETHGMEAAADALASFRGGTVGKVVVAPR